MKRSREVLEKKLTHICSYVALNSETCNKIYDFAKDKYDIPRGLTSDLICLRMSMGETTEFILFCILDALIEITGNIANISDYYTKQEINQYSKSKYKVDKIKFPLRLKMIQIKNDQWIGSIDIKMLMKLRAAQLINYNANAQRVMTKVIRGDKEIYKITLNQTAVNEIEKCYTERTFIPNTITLNIPMENGDDFYYDENKSELVINKIQHFNILDAYHRYIAACKASDMDKNFNYDMELRIVNWDDAKSQTFIWQEDKKTPLKKIDRESLNMNKVSNIIVERLNNNINCNMKGLIKRNDYIINFGEMSELINWFYLKDNKKGNINTIQLKIVRELTENLNILTESDIKYLEERWDYKLLLSAMCVFYYSKDNSIDKQNMHKLIEKVYDEILKSNDKKFKNKTPRKVLIDAVMEIIENNV